MCRLRKRVSPGRRVGDASNTIEKGGKGRGRKRRGSCKFVLGPIFPPLCRTSREGDLDRMDFGTTRLLFLNCRVNIAHKSSSFSRSNLAGSGASDDGRGHQLDGFDRTGGWKSPAGHRSRQSDRVISPLSRPCTSAHSLPLFPFALLCPTYPICLRVAARADRMRVHVPLGCNACAVVEHRTRQLAATGASRRGSPRSSSKAGSFRVAPASGINVARQTHSGYTLPFDRTWRRSAFPPTPRLFLPDSQFFPRPSPRSYLLENRRVVSVVESEGLWRTCGWTTRVPQLPRFSKSMPKALSFYG